jgi:hypothetical protein
VTATSVHRYAMARYEALSRRPRTARAWRAIASRLIHAATALSRTGNNAASAKHLQCAEQALARAFDPTLHLKAKARSIAS